jgi:hypothetical protein
MSDAELVFSGTLILLAVLAFASLLFVRHQKKQERLEEEQRNR